MPSADRPMPVSRTANVSSALPVPRAPRVTVSTTSPRSVNLTALDSRLSRICRRRVTSPTIAAGHVAFEHVGGVEVLLDRARGDEVERRLDAFAQVERLRLDVHAPGFDLGEVEDVVDDREQRVARIADGGDVVVLLGVERVSSSSPLMPITAFIGVRISWLIVARNELFASLAASAAARASCASRNRRAFCSATPTLAAIVTSRRSSSAS